jgi:hypothetical protein
MSVTLTFVIARFLLCFYVCFFFRQHRNVITGEGLRAYLSKDHSSHRVEDGACDSYAYYKDRVISGKEMGQNYRSTAQLQWTAHKYTPNALPKKWKWTQ